MCNICIVCEKQVCECDAENFSTVPPKITELLTKCNVLSPILFQKSVEVLTKLNEDIFNKRSSYLTKVNQAKLEIAQLQLQLSNRIALNDGKEHSSECKPSQNDICELKSVPILVPCGASIVLYPLSHINGRIWEIENQFKINVRDFRNFRENFLENCIAGFTRFKIDWQNNFNTLAHFEKQRMITIDRPDIRVVFEAFNCAISEHDPSLTVFTNSAGEYIKLLCIPKR